MSSLQQWRLRLLALALLAPAVGCWMYHPVTGIFPIEEESEEEKALLLGALALSGGSGAVSGPEISIRRLGVEIANGGNFVFPTSAPLVFTIENSGGQALVLSALGNSSPANFSLMQPGGLNVAAGGSETFTMQNVSGGGATVVTVPNNDADESPYTLNMTGCGC